MRRYLIVANETLAGSHLIRKISECLAAGSCTFYVVVPSTPAREGLIWTEGGARAAAHARLGAALARFRALGAEIEGEVGDPSPVHAVGDVLRIRTFEEMIVSTLPPGPSRWLRMDLPHRLARIFGLPVTHLVGESEPVVEAS